MSLISPSLAQRIEQARQAQLRAQKAAANSGWRPSKSDRKDRYARWHVDETVESDAENWLLSYLDLITLLLAMLVVMLAVSRLHGGFYESGEQPVDLVGSLAAKGLPAYDGEYAEFDTPAIPASWADAGKPAAAAAGAPATAAPAAEGEVVAQAAAPLKAPSKESLGLGDLGKSVDVIINEQSVSFRISNELLFPSGQATLSPSGLDVIKRLAAILNKNEYQVSVEGHSDPVPIQTRQFASNWELSSSRATSVLRELVRDGVAGSRLRAVGYAETRPIESNDTPAGRAANRRVELIMDITAPAKPAQADAKGTDGKPAAAAANGKARPAEAKAADAKAADTKAADAKTADAKAADAKPAETAAATVPREAAPEAAPPEATPPSTLTPTEATAATQS
ncbi:Peptidoglycan-associated lipoprotein [Achromobacter insuavis]|uniref:OmpA/MotB family protein n=1 Tax=Achromobacter insuavis TaxID=1287735 RepID=UPI00146578C8|nr:OmpA family protein [Achromobacter insuavis]CAB3921657.1 Peptidoglycan-associated lipoprotein [Achromobacter insuavis]